MIERARWYDELTRGFEQDPEYWVEYLKLVFGEEVGRLMDERGMSQAELARKLDVSRAYITRLFRGTFNPTVETLVKVALALDARVALHLHSCHADVRWLDVSRPVAALPAEAEVWANNLGRMAEQPVAVGRHDVADTFAA